MLWLLVCFSFGQSWPLLSRSSNDEAPDFDPPGYRIASEMLTKSINFSADPCVDFFQFTCGNWIAKHPIPDDKSSISQLGMLSEEVRAQMREIYESPEILRSKSASALKSIYRKCMDKDELNRIGAKKLIETIRGFGVWPMLDSDKWRAEYFNLTSLFIHVSGKRRINAFMSISVKVDGRNVSQYLIQFKRGELGLGESTRDYYLDREKHGTKIAAYRQLFISMVKLIHEDAKISINESKINNDVDEIIALETTLAQIQAVEGHGDNTDETVHHRQLSEIQKLMPMVDWFSYFYSIAPPSVHSYIAADPEICIRDIDYVRRVTNLLKVTDPRIITNYFYILHSFKWLHELGERYEDVAQESKNATLDMIDELQDAFLDMVNENEWIDSTTKAAVVDKTKHMLRQIGYPEFILDDKKLDEYYSGLSIKDSDSYSQMVEKVNRWNIEFDFKRLMMHVDRNEYSSNPAVVDPAYSPISNSIKFPAAALQAPYFHPTFPKSLSYGGLGTVIGHEITHGFDTNGRFFDAVGNLRDWWTRAMTEEFERRAQCFTDQYAKIEMPGTGLHLNGKKTLPENIADNGGVKQAFKAYKKYLKKFGEEKRVEGLEEYTDEQMFFIGYGAIWCGHWTTDAMINNVLTDPHAPNRDRVNVVLANQPDFAVAFGCDAGSPMNPTNRCAVW